MIGFRGAARYVDASFADCFALECEAMQRVREDMGIDNIWLMVPFVRTVNEAEAVTMVLEMIPAVLAAELSTHLQPPTIGIGSGRDCDGQVLVLHDMLGLSAGARKRFVKNFMADAESVQDALIAYVQAVKNGDFPAAENAF
jgi:3-methyl-2-oxobutanoate hydroxymethyltransferase